ncbi:MAG: cytochrome b/b6 domain-containing protein [Verrucomicrobiota bacterium]|jgi:formate dehydrogenase gamma subunit
MGIRFILTLAAGLLATTAPAAAEMQNSDCLDCHSDKTLTATNAAGRVTSLFVDPAVLAASVHRTNSCAICHNDITDKHPDDHLAPRAVDCARCHLEPSLSYAASVHGVAHRDGTTNGTHHAPVCPDCHGSHGVLTPDSPQSPLHFSNLAKTCGQCHEQEAKDVMASVHGKAVAAGRRDAATCTDCHSEHKIEALRGSSSLKISQEICSKCHASKRLNTKYNLPPDRVKTFFASYHGLAAQYGSTRAANCGSCHGFHLVLPSSDPLSSIYKDNLAATCGKCHVGASANFAQSKVHVDIEAAGGNAPLGERINWWVRQVYLAMIFSVVGLMAVHNALIFGRKAAALSRRTERTLVRMDAAQRWQHWALAASFIALAWTGFALKFPDSWVAHSLGSSETFRRWSHRIAGVVLLLAGAYHLGYISASREGRRLVRDMIPGPKDVREAAANMRWLAGLGGVKPKFGRFGYAEKMEYWAVVWGTIIMGATGLMIWFKMEVTRFLPRWAVDVATTIHYYEAILACLAILVWHFYHVIFDPDVYPLNRAVLDGRVSREWLEEEHPLDPALAGGHPDAPAGGASPREAPANNGKL